MSTESLLKGPLEPELPDELSYETSLAGNLEDTQVYLIFFMTGNPGLITYYDPFLSELRGLLESARPSKMHFHICGHSFRGMEVSQHAEPPSSPLGLKDQIRDQEKWLMHYVKAYQASVKGTLKVVLVGHSVGSYVLLELIQRHLDAVERDPDVADFDLIGGILLFPTIAEIGESPLGRFARLILPLPGFARIMGALARTLAYFIPKAVIVGLVRYITKFPDYAVATTTAFLQSSTGVRQALYLARDEMRMIKEDDWDNEVWGATTSPGTNKRDTINWNLILFWGQGDNWVADHTREHIIKARGSHSQPCEAGEEQTRCNMVVDDQGVPHDFCTTIGNSHYVAGKVKGWIDDIIEKHRKAI